MSKLPHDALQAPSHSNASELIARSENLPSGANDAPQQVSIARVLGQPEGPFGTAVTSKNTILLRSLGTARFAKFETLELAPHGAFVVLSNPAHQSFQTKSTLVDFELFLGDPQAAGTKIIKGVARIEEIRPAIDVPLPTPAGYILKIVQLTAEALNQLENYVHERLLKAAM